MPRAEKCRKGDKPGLEIDTDVKPVVLNWLFINAKTTSRARESAFVHAFGSKMNLPVIHHAAEKNFRIFFEFSAKQF